MNPQLTRCIACGNSAVRLFLDLGEMALANKFLTKEELARPEPRYPLRVGFCNACGHVQLTEAVPPATMFEDYLYISSASETLKNHLYDLSDIVTERYSLGPEDLVVDVGCNDGTLLGGFQRHGVRTLGVDPAKNLAERAQNSGIARYIGFFDAQSAEVIRGKWGAASAITATNTFPHIPDLAGFLKGIQTALAPDGVFVIEMHYLVDLLEQGAFDTIYHEHVSYWALTAMKRLFERHGMEIVNAERVPLHHGQLRVFVQRRGVRPAQPGAAKILAAEHEKGIDRFETYERFARKTLEIKENVRRTLHDLRAQGKRIVGYGAPAKGNTLLTFLGIGPDVIEYIADLSPLKQGRYTPGTHILVVPPERLLQDRPDYVLLLAWNFADEVLRQQAEYRRRGGRFIIPVPEVSIR